MIALAPLPDRLVLFPTTHRIDAGAASSKANSVRRRRTGNLEGRLQIGPAARARPGLHLAILWQCRSRRSLGRSGNGNVGQPAGRSLGNELPGLRRQHGSGATRPVGAGCARRIRCRQTRSARSPHHCFWRESGDHHRTAYRRASTGLGPDPAQPAPVAADYPAPIRLVEFVALRRTDGARKFRPIWTASPTPGTVRVPAIFLLAENDEVVAPKFQRLVVEAYAGEKRVIPLAGAGHNSPIEGTELTQLQNGFDWLLSPMWERPSASPPVPQSPSPSH